MLSAITTTTFPRTSTPVRSLLSVGSASSWIPRIIPSSRTGQTTLQADASFALTYFDWLKGAIEGTQVPQQGVITNCDSLLRATERYAFTRALVTSVTFPTLDASSKDPAQLTVSLDVTGAAPLAASGKTALFPLKTQVGWMQSDFRFAANKFDGRYVTHVDSLTFAPNSNPELKIRMPDTYAEPLRRWHNDFVINGNNSSSAEDVMALSYLNPMRTAVLFSLEFYGVGIYKLTTSPRESTETIRTVEASFYVHFVRLKKG